MATIGENIKRLRKSAGMSQDQLGEKIGKTRSAVSQYESGIIVPRMGVIEDLAHVFRVSKTEILEDAEHYAVASLDDEDELLRLFRSMNAHGREQLMVFARGCAASYPLNQVDSMGA